MKTVEIRRFDGEDRIFIDNQLFDWGIDEEALSQINQISNPEEIKKIHENIKRYFLGCFESYLGRPTSIKEVLEAIQSGQIE
jgi:hypothetical protein